VSSGVRSREATPWSRRPKRDRVSRRQVDDAMPMTIRGGGDPRPAWLARRLREWACRLRALPPMRMTASWSGSARNPPNTGVWRDRSRPGRAPLGSSPGHLPAGSDAAASRKARLAVHPPSACSGVKACPWLEQGVLRNTSLAKAARRPAALAFRSLDPFRALREPDRWRQDEEWPFQLRTKNCQQNQKNKQQIDCPATRET
jgi:hypothetical protein